MKHDLRNKILSILSRCVDMTVATVKRGRVHRRATVVRSRMSG